MNTGQRGEAGRLELDAFGPVAQAGEQVSGLADALDRGQRDHDAGGVRVLYRGFEHGAVAAAGEDRVGGRQVLERLRRAAVDDPQADVVPGGVVLDPRALGLVRVDRDHVGAEPRALHRHRTRAGPHVPDRAAGGRAEPGQHQRADLRLGDHRVAVLERVLGQRPAVRGALVARQPARRARRRLLAECDEDVGVGEVAGWFGGQVGEVFLRGAETLGDVHRACPRPAGPGRGHGPFPARSGWRPWGARGRRRAPGPGRARGPRPPGRRPSPGPAGRTRARPTRRPG